VRKKVEKQEIVAWSERYDEQHPWWVEKEKRLGEKLRQRGELTKEDLIRIVEWKFQSLPGRKKRILSLVAQNQDGVIRSVSSSVLKLPREHDYEKIGKLTSLHGVGPAIASTILTFHDPKNYGVFDIHVWRELFGKETQPLFTTRNCLTLLSKLRELAGKHYLDVRMIEKALFKKNIHRSYAGTTATKNATQTLTRRQRRSQVKRGHTSHHSTKHRTRWSTISSTLVPRLAQPSTRKITTNSTTR